MRQTLSRVIGTLGVCLVVAKSLPLLVAAGLHMDESYYIGAARTVLRGDLLLTTYGFDKPFLPPFLLTPGILFLGENVAGFRFTGLLFGIASFILSWRICAALWRLTSVQHQVAQPNKTFWLTTSSALVALVLFLNPLMLAHETSAMTEPFLCFFLLLGLWFVIRPQNPGNWYLPWAFAAMAKFSAVMWLPLFIAIDLIVRRRTWRTIASGFWRETKWVWIIAIFFQLFNQKKFIAFTWFSHLGSSAGKNSTPMADRFIFWWGSLNDNWFNGGGLILLILLATLTAVSIQLFKGKFKSSDSSKWVFVLLGATVLHFVGISLSRAPLYERYLVIFFPQLIFSILVAFVYWADRLRLKKTIQITIPVTAIAMIAFELIQPTRYLEEKLDLGRKLQASRDLLPFNALLASPLSWETRPYESKSWQRPLCTDLNCLWRERRTAADQPQFVLKRHDDGQFVLEAGPIVLDWKTNAACYSVKTESKKFRLNESLQRAIQTRIRIRDNDAKFSMIVSPSQPADLKWTDQADLTAFGQRDLLQGLPTEVGFVKGNVTGKLRGHLILTDRYNLNATEKDYGLVWYLDGASIQTNRLPLTDLTDFVPITFRARAIPLARIAIPEPHSQNVIQLLSFDSSNNSIQTKVTTVHTQANCIQ